MSETFLSYKQTREHGTAIFQAVLRADPDSIYVMHSVLEAYAVAGTLLSAAHQEGQIWP